MATKIAVMNGGVIQQFGAPDEIYERPANLFVAGFIGAPPMNLLAGELTGQGGAWRVTAGDGIAADLSAYPFAAPPVSGTRVMLGMRPEHFHLNAPLADAALSTTLPVVHVERTGSDAIVSLALAKGRLDARIDPEAAARLKTGDRLRADFPGNKISLFNADTGTRL